MTIREVVNQWKDLTPRERDAAVAEHVMGWKWYTFLDKAYILPPYAEDMGLVFGLNWPNLGWFHGKAPDATAEIDPVSLSKLFGYGPPKYTTQIQVAWTLVDKFMKEGWEWEIHPRVNLVSTSMGVWQGDTVPEAICLTALSLEALRQEVEGG